MHPTLSDAAFLSRWCATLWLHHRLGARWRLAPCHTADRSLPWCGPFVCIYDLLAALRLTTRHPNGTPVHARWWAHRQAASVDGGQPGHRAGRRGTIARCGSSSGVALSPTRSTSLVAGTTTTPHRTRSVRKASQRSASPMSEEQRQAGAASRSLRPQRNRRQPGNTSRCTVVVRPVANTDRRRRPAVGTVTGSCRVLRGGPDAPLDDVWSPAHRA